LIVKGPVTSNVKQIISLGSFTGLVGQKLSMNLACQNLSGVSTCFSFSVGCSVISNCFLATMLTEKVSLTFFLFSHTSVFLSTTHYLFTINLIASELQLKLMISHHRHFILEIVGMWADQHTVGLSYHCGYQSKTFFVWQSKIVYHLVN